MWPFAKDAKGRLGEALGENDHTKDLDLEVEVMSGKAYVSGEVPDERYENLIRSIANGINGIDDLDLSGIVAGAVTPGGTSAEAADSAADRAAGGFDPGGNAKVALEKIKGEPTLAKNPLDILQNGSKITLRGAVETQAELDSARALILSVAGVSDVDTSGVQVTPGGSGFNVTDEAGFAMIEAGFQAEFRL